MAAFSGVDLQKNTEYTGITIIAGCLILPALSPLLFGWIGALMPTPAFFFLQRLGTAAGYRLLKISLLFAAVISVLFKVLPLLLFTVTFLAIPVVLHRAAATHQHPVKAGAQALAALALAWTLFWTVFAITSGTNPYTTLLTTITQSLEQTLVMYRQGKQLSPDMLLMLETSIAELQTLLPRIVPGSIAAGLVFIVWINQSWGNMLISLANTDGHSPWPPFRTWRLPDHLVWPLIAGALLFMVFSDTLETFGLNLLIATASIFTLQGVAVLVFFLHKSNIPKPLRLVIYGLLIMQTYGILFITLVGIIDIWADFRSRKSPDEPAAFPQ